jgi:O-antigen/teichoic acid export membrane protein
VNPIRALARRSIGDRLPASVRSVELRGLAGDSLLAGIWQGATSIGDLVVIALVSNVLGLREYGRLALVVAFVTLVGQFFDVRVGTAATTFGAAKVQSDMRAAAGVFQLSYVVDFVTGVIGFAFVLLLAPLVGPGLVGRGGTGLIALYALTLLAATVNDSSLAVLRLLNRFRLIAGYTVALQILRVALVTAALSFSDRLAWVVAALLAAEVVGGTVNALAAKCAFARASGGVSLARPALSAARNEVRPMLRTIVHTNVVSYARLAQTQAPTLLVGAIAGPLQAGMYKLGMAIAAIVGRLADPAYAAVLPRLSRLWAAGGREAIGRLVKYASVASFSVMAVALLLVVVLRNPMLDLLGGGHRATAGATVVVLGAAAQAVNGTLFWNVPLLFAAGRAASVAKLALAGIVVQVVLLLALVPSFAATGAALAFFVTLLATNAAATLIAVHAIRSAETPGATERPYGQPKPAIEDPGSQR